MFKQVIQLIDEANSHDPNKEQHANDVWPKERLYSERMTNMLDRFMPSADELMYIAVRGQHIERWQSPRSDFALGKQGYYKWRTALYGFHAGRVVGLMQQVGFDDNACQRVYNAWQKSR